MYSLQSGFAPLHMASRYGSVDVGQILIDHGANVDAKAKVERTISNTKFAETNEELTSTT